MHLIKNYLTRRILKNHTIAFKQWHVTTSKMPLLRSLTITEKVQLRKLCTLFIYHKTFSGAGDLSVTYPMQITVAAQACLMILGLGMQAFNGWEEIIIYPGAFKVDRTFVSADGLVHQENQNLSGEAWDRGPVILSWQDVERESFNLIPGHNLIIHEFAHKLDMLNGRANGMPPLHPTMPVEEWTQALNQAYESLQKNIGNFQQTYITPYAGKNPAEFFAVISEYFFTAPEILEQYCPDVYEQLKQYYRQDTLQRLSR